jgi:hypothetical protein
VELHGSQIEVTREGDANCFHFTLPL